MFISSVASIIIGIAFLAAFFAVLLWLKKRILRYEIEKYEEEIAKNREEKIKKALDKLLEEVRKNVALRSTLYAVQTANIQTVKIDISILIENYQLGSTGAKNVIFL